MSKTLSQALAPASSAAIVGFDPATAGLQAATVKAALDELAGLLAVQAQAQGLSFSVYNNSNPLYIAHRGGALMYPENTLQAYRAAVLAGSKCIEGDVQLLSDGGLAVMHDTTVDATTTSTGTVASRTTAQWNALQIDANTWHRSNFGNALTPPLLPAVLSEFKGRALIIMEAKAGSTGDEIVAAYQAAKIPKYQGMVAAFALGDLSAAVAAGYPAMFVTSVDTDIAAAQAAGVTWVAVSQAASNTVFTNWVNAGFRVVAWAVNRRYRRDELLSLGVSGFFSDDPEYLSTSSPKSGIDNFSAQTWQRGMLAHTDGQEEATRGSFVSADRWGFATNPGASYNGVLQGWACPIKGNPNADSFTMDFKVRFDTASAADRWASVWLQSTDVPYANASATTENGYHLLVRKSGAVQIYKVTAGAAALLNAAGATAIADGEEVAYRLTVTPTTLTLSRLNSAGAATDTATATDNTFRGGYFQLGRNGLACRFRDVSIY